MSETKTNKADEAAHKFTFSVFAPNDLKSGSYRLCTNYTIAGTTAYYDGVTMEPRERGTQPAEISNSDPWQWHQSFMVTGIFAIIVFGFVQIAPIMKRGKR